MLKAIIDFLYNWLGSGKEKEQLKKRASEADAKLAKERKAKVGLRAKKEYEENKEKELADLQKEETF